MPAVQSTYLSSLAAGTAGMVVNMGDNEFVSRQVESAAIGFGVALKQGAADNGVIAATAAADVFVGISVRDQSARPGLADQVAVADDLLVLKEGVVWVIAGGVCTVGTAAYMVVGTGQAGRYVSSPTSNLPIVRGTFDSSATTAGDLVKLRLS
jgi:hypothetical protein